MSRTTHRILEEIAEERKELRIQVVLTVLAGVGLVVGALGQWLDWSFIVVVVAFIVAYLAGGLPAAREAISSLIKGELNIDLLMVLAALAAAGVGEVRDGAILLFLFSLAGTLEHYAMGNTKRSVAALMDLRPDEANRKTKDGSTERVRVEELNVGDEVVVRPGERIPIDGVVAMGMGAVDQSPITGESVPVDKSIDDKVFAGSVNQNAQLTIAVTATAAHSTLARMIDLVTEAQEKRSPSESFSDWFGERYTVVVLVGSIVALGVFLLLDMPTELAFYKAATLLVVASPCAIVISVPAAVLSALANSARHGVLFKGGAALEDFGNVSVLALDKTGTLTSGVMEVVHVVSFVESEENLLSLAATLEAHSDHPLARSIVSYARAQGIRTLESEAAAAVPGKGVIATIKGEVAWAGNRALLQDQGVTLLGEQDAQIGMRENDGETPIFIGSGSILWGVVTLADTPRASAVEALAGLRKAGIKKVVMLTGDSMAVAQAIGARLGFAADTIFGGLLPEDKVARVTALAAHGRLAFVGDGVNDAAALATARVGVAMGVAGTDAALEAADVALLSDDLRQLAYAYALSKKANRIIKQNLIFSCGIMALMVVTTVFWHLPLPLGVIGHEGGTLLVVANGLRLLFSK
ncbi:cadmium-translocating P-type ATPase [Patescibacteria group bacterium]|nr:cadmium-translocating P-type ATPase [Patescibacteria group bacterium]